MRTNPDRIYPKNWFLNGLVRNASRNWPTTVSEHAMHETDGDMRQWCKEWRERGYIIYSCYGVNSGTPVYEGERGPLTCATACFDRMINWF